MTPKKPDGFARIGCAKLDIGDDKNPTVSLVRANPLKSKDSRAREYL